MNTHAAQIAPGAVTVGGAPEGWDAKLLADLVDRTGGPVLHVARDDARAAAMVEALGIFAPGLPVLTLPAWDCLPYDRVSPNPEISAERMATLAALAHGWDRPSVLLTTLNAATQKVPAREALASGSFVASVDASGRCRRADRLADGQGVQPRLDRDRAWRLSPCAAASSTSSRPGQEMPVRLDFFGDVLEGARRFDPESQRTVETVSRVELAPASEVVLDGDAIQRFRTRYREIFGAARLDDPLYAAVSEGRKYQGMEHWVALFHPTMETVFDYLPGTPVSLDHRVDEARAARWETIGEHYEARARQWHRERDTVSAVPARAALSR